MGRWEAGESTVQSSAASPGGGGNEERQGLSLNSRNPSPPSRKLEVQGAGRAPPKSPSPWLVDASPSCVLFCMSVSQCPLTKTVGAGDNLLTSFQHNNLLKDPDFKQRHSERRGVRSSAMTLGKDHCQSMAISRATNSVDILPPIRTKRF